MHSPRRPPPEHTKLLLSLANELTQYDTEKLRMRCGASDVNLPPRAMANKSSQGLITLLDQRRIFRHNDYSKLAEILMDIQRGDLVHRYLNGNISVESSPCPDQAISDMLLQQFANNLGHGWKSFLRGELGVLDNEIALVQQSNPHSPVQEHIFQALKLWRDKNRGKATVRALIERCEASLDLEYECYQCLVDSCDGS